MSVSSAVNVHVTSEAGHCDILKFGYTSSTKYLSWPSPCCVMLLGGDAAVDVDACSSEVSLQKVWARPSSRTYTAALYGHVVLVSPHRVFVCEPAQTLT